MLSAQSVNRSYQRRTSSHVRGNANHFYPTRPQSASVVDKTFIAEAPDRDASIWMLWVEKCGRSILQYEGDIVAMIDCHQGAEVLHLDECPFERAEDLITLVTKDLAVQMDVNSRMSLETDLARWIAENL
jgi:hypothetical protein